MLDIRLFLLDVLEFSHFSLGYDKYSFHPHVGLVKEGGKGGKMSLIILSVYFEKIL